MKKSTSPKAVSTDEPIANEATNPTTATVMMMMSNPMSKQNAVKRSIPLAKGNESSVPSGPTISMVEGLRLIGLVVLLADAR